MNQGSKASEAGWVLSARAKTHHWEGQGWLSLKTFEGGSARYRLGRGEYRVNPRHGLIVNHDQPYRIEVNETEPLESLCLFFAPESVRETQADVTAPLEAALEGEIRGAMPTFFERAYRLDGPLGRSVERVRAALTEPDPVPLEVALRAVLLEMFCANGAARQEALRLKSARPATRLELYRRLHRAREFMLANLERPLPLSAVANVANLSVNHLLRGFRDAFGVSPHQFLVRQRLERARDLLRQGGRGVTDVCFETGFQSLGSFSARFRREFGVAPSGVRGDFEEAVGIGTP